MRTNLLVAMLVGLAAAGAAQAQTVTRIIPLADFNLPVAATVTPVDIDGNPDTEEWTITHEGRWKVAVVRSRVCLGEWFDPRPFPFTMVRLARLGRRDVLIVQPSTGPVRVVSLDAPACDD
jgi:hypothetical protein